MLGDNHDHFNLENDIELNGLEAQHYEEERSLLFPSINKEISERQGEEGESSEQTYEFKVRLKRLFFF